MLLAEIHNLLELSVPEIKDTESTIKQMFHGSGLGINFTSHFFERISDGAIDHNGVSRDTISVNDLMGLFARLTAHIERIKQLAVKYTKQIRARTFGAAVVWEARGIQMPFTLSFDTNKGIWVIVCKTIWDNDEYQHYDRLTINV